MSGRGRENPFSSGVSHRIFEWSVITCNLCMLKSRSRSGPQRRHLDLKEAIIAFIKLKNMVKYFIKQRKLAGEWKVVRCKYALPKKRKPSDFIKTDWENYEKHSLTKWRRYVDKWTMQEWLKMEEQDIAKGKKPMLGITKDERL